MEDEVVSYWRSEVENPTVKQLFNEWMERKLEYHDICVGTFNRYERDFKRYYEDDSGLADRRIRI